MAGVGWPSAKLLPGDNHLSFRPQRAQDVLAKILAAKQRREAAVGFRQLLVHLFVEQVAGPEPHPGDVAITAHRKNCVDRRISEAAQRPFPPGRNNTRVNLSPTHDRKERMPTAAHADHRHRDRRRHRAYAAAR